MKTLVIDDELTSRLIVNRYLEPFGEVQGAEDGEDGLALFQSAYVELAPFDLVILDIMMPEMDGHQVLRELRKIDAEHGRAGNMCTKVVMVSASDAKDDILTAFNEQCEAYIVKPMKKHELLAQLSSLGLIDPAAAQ